MNDFYVGDWVEIEVSPETKFAGTLDEINDLYVVIDGRGFPVEDIHEMRHA